MLKTNLPSATKDLIITFLLMCFFTTGLSSQNQILLFHERTQQTFQITDDDQYHHYNPALSPNGRYVIYDRLAVDDGTQDLAISPLRGNGSRAIPSASGGNDATWSPRGRHIAFDREPAGDPSIYVLQLGSGQPELLVKNALDPEWSPNGMYIVYENTLTGLLNTINVRTRAITSLNIKGLEPSLSRNGKYLAYANEGHIYWTKINSNGTGTGVSYQLTDDLLTGDNHPTWHGFNKIVYASYNPDTDNSDLYIAHIFSGEIRLYIGSKENQEYDPDYLRGMTVYSGGAEVNHQALSSKTAVSLITKELPNPMSWNNRTLEFEMKEPGAAWISILTSQGQILKIQQYDHLRKGRNKVDLSLPTDLISGVYYLQVRTAEEITTKGFSIIQ